MERQIHYSRKEAAEYLRVSYAQINNLIDEYGLRYYLVGKKKIFDKQVLDTFLKRNEINSNKEAIT
ncbi:MAG: excisionase family DNA-binding protein [Chlorobiota bacterium]